MKKLQFTIFFIFLLGGFFFIPTVQAFTITPARQTAIVDPGGTQAVRLTVKNEEKEKIEIKGEVEGFTIEEKTHRAVFGVNDEATAWVKINPTVSSLQPGESKDIIFYISVPKTAEPKVHYLVLFAEVKPGAGQVGISSRLGSLVFLYVSGNVHEEMSGVDFSSGSSVYLNNKGQLFAQAENTGTIHLIPQGKITLLDARGKVKSEFVVNKENNLVLPGSLWSETYDFHFQPLQIGKTEARLEFKYGINEQTVFKKISFWYIPLWLIGTGIGIIFLLILGMVVVGIKIGRKK